MCIKDKLGKLVAHFNKKAESDEQLKEYVDGMERSIVFNLTDDKAYNTKLSNSQLSDVIEGGIDDAEIIIETDKATMLGLLDGSVKPMKAYATKKLKIKASLQDMMLMRKLM